MPIDITQARNVTYGCVHVSHLNNAGAGLMPSPVIEAIKTHLDLEAESGGYEAAARARALWENTYDALAKLLNCDRSEIALIENATRAWDMAMYAVPLKEGDRVLTASNEYSSNWLALMQIRQRTGCSIELVPNNEYGEIDTDALAAMMDDRVKVVALTHVAASNGMVQPAAEVGRIVKNSEALYLLDACQSAGQMQLDMDAIGCDILSGTGRKFLRGPRGTGFLYVNKRVLHRLEPPFVDQRAADWVAMDRYEWLEDARRFENWETSYALRIGLGVAVDHALYQGLDEIESRVKKLAADLRARLGVLNGVKVQDTGRVKSGIVTFSLVDKDVMFLQKHLVMHGINITAAPAGIARLDLETRGIAAICRASVHYYNTEEEIERFVSEVEKYLRLIWGEIERSKYLREMNRVLLILLISGLLLLSCRNDVLYCENYTEITSRDHLHDLRILEEAPILLQILDMHPELQVYRVINDQYSIGMHCNVFHHDLLVFTTQHVYILGKSTGLLFMNNDAVELPTGFLFDPSIDHLEARLIAKEQIDLGPSCLTYRLGIFDVNAGRGDMPEDHRLAWKVQGPSGIPYVVVDAHTGEVIRKDDGRRY